MYISFMTSLSKNITSVQIRKLEPWILQTHSNLAQNDGISLEAYLRALLEKQALKAQEDMAIELRQTRADIAAEFGTNFTDSVELIRAERQDSEH